MVNSYRFNDFELGSDCQLQSPSLELAETDQLRGIPFPHVNLQQENGSLTLWLQDKLACLLLGQLDTCALRLLGVYCSISPKTLKNQCH